MKEYIVSKSESGQTLMKFLQRKMKEAPGSFFHKMLRKKNITLNGSKCDGKEKLSEGDTVKIFVSDETFDKFSLGANVSSSEYRKAYEALSGVEVVCENDDFVFLNKPFGILSQKSSPNDYSLNEWLIGYLLHSGSISEASLNEFKPSVCNRLDRNTAGIVICSKSLPGAIKASELLKSRDLGKFYHCLVKGEFNKDGVYEHFLYKDEKNNKVTVFDSKEQFDNKAHIKDFTVNPDKVLPVKTGIKCLEVRNGFSLLEIELFTGKSHQIRAVLSHLGFPILGDRKYDGITVKDKDNIPAQYLACVRVVFPKLDGNFEYMSNLKLEIEDAWNF